MYNLVYSNIAFYSCEEGSFLVFHRHNNKRRFNYLSHALAKNCRSLIVAVNGPSMDYEENPTQDYEHDRKKTWNMLRTLTDPRYANKIVELTFASVDLLPSNIFAQTNMADFLTLRLLRIINCREFGLIDVTMNDWSFIAKRGIEVQYNWKYARIPRTYGNYAGAILSRMFKWRLKKTDTGKKAIFDNLRTNRQFRSNISSAFTSHWVPLQLDDPGFRGAYDLHDFIFKDTKAYDLSRAIVKIHQGFHAHYAGNFAREYECRECEVMITGACYPLAQIRG